ncbi:MULTISPECIES: ribonuclease HI [unclassified Tolypothrix]|uniref:ribonuclease HI n=1 Tax=unclassified Tolypothrix TaxID=2649714 RepID=UPI0005EAB618|nr:MULTISPECIES: ribonuclease HI [unclassified Tolypothrix]BAY94580.1 ribonuclease H [Microchaete diplosiphon NIES-3275]EKE99213.1 ribonuclease H [Tolypothrix sp. PCC 7601]MBE9082008.1 ribonuclease HI [Tolypothrix sp. LEGE 11397]UYD28282.1 ribonuclease HI [Tolypothrix sp. PCC 7712]UYD35843.1 ribonuclease HI [Tolypothrix sp. PCC 7601]
MSQRRIQSIYTDGACTGNPGPGGWGVVVYFNDGSIHEIGGASSHTTNNKMEMQAAIAGLQFLQTSGQTQPITLYTDSEYLINSVTKWIKGWKQRGWKKADGKPVQNQDLLETLDELNSYIVKWEYVRGHSGNVGNERCDVIARTFASGRVPDLKQSFTTDADQSLPQTNQINVAKVTESSATSTIIDTRTPESSTLASNITIMEPTITNSTNPIEDKPPALRVEQLRDLVETLRIADEIATKGYLITSSELADLMDVHASAVTSRGDQWRWRNWIVSRVRREGNQILWELERGDQVGGEEE